MQLSIRYDDNLHKKLKVIAAYKEKSLNALIQELFNKAVEQWENTHGTIVFDN